MSDWKSDLDRLILGKTFDDYLRPVPGYDNIIEGYTKTLMSNHPVRLLGYSTEGEVWLSEEDRESHIEIIGTTGEGKSKFLEMMVSKDIDSLMKGKSKSGLCFIDSSDNGNTMKKVLKFCCKKKFEKVLVIDPHHIRHQDYGFVVPINPFGKLKEFDGETRYNTPTEAIQAHVAESIRINWESQFQTEAIISEYMPYVIQALHGANATLADSEAFVHRHLKDKRARIIAACDNYHVNEIFAKIYKNEREYDKFGSTRRRFDPYRHSVLQATFGSTKGVDFRKLITDGWVILVNLYDQGLFEEKHQRLLGTHILNEIIMAMSRIKEHSPDHSVPYYIYIDEFSQYATEKIADMLYRSRQSGLRLNLAHQDFEQISNKKVLAAVRGQAKTKIAFYLTHPKDRMEVVQMCYGGALADREVSYALSQTKKQQAVVKINKADPVVTKIRDWPDAVVEGKELKEYILKLYKSNPDHYRPTAEVWEELKNRFATSSTTKTSRAESHPQPGGSSDKVTGSYSAGRVEKRRADSNTGQQAPPVGQQGGDKVLPGQRQRKKDILPKLVQENVGSTKEVVGRPKKPKAGLPVEENPTET